MKQWYDEATDNLNQSKKDLAEAQLRINQAEERLVLIRQLLELEGIEEEKPPDKKNDTKSLVDHCVQLLRDAGKPMHVKEIQSALLESGIPIPGKGTEANVIARIQRSNGKIIRTGRGTYGLPEFGIPEAKPVRRRRQSNRSRTTK